MKIKLVGGLRDGAEVEIYCEPDDPTSYYDVLEDGTVWHRYVQRLGPPSEPPTYRYIGLRDEQTQPWWHK